MQVFYGHTGPVRCGQFTPDGKTIVTGGGEGDATLKVWDPKSGTCTGTIQGYGFHEAGRPRAAGCTTPPPPPPPLPLHFLRLALGLALGNALRSAHAFAHEHGHAHALTVL